MDNENSLSVSLQTLWRPASSLSLLHPHHLCPLLPLVFLVPCHQTLWSRMDHSWEEVGEEVRLKTSLVVAPEEIGLKASLVVSAEEI